MTASPHRRDAAPRLALPLALTLVACADAPGAPTSATTTTSTTTAAAASTTGASSSTATSSADASTTADATATAAAATTNSTGTDTADTTDTSAPTTCPCFAGDGPYCGASLKPGEADNVLFQCKGKATESKQTCANGCQVNPPGVPDECKGGGGNNECCLQKPPGTLTQSYSACGQGGSHYGIDYGTAVGTPIYAGMAGTVVGLATGYPNCYNNGCSQSCWNAFNYVKIKSDCGDPNEGGKDFFIYYLHIDSLAPGIAKNVHVDQGQLVAYSGNSGCSSGPHIHIETVSVPAGQSASLSTCSSQNPAGHYCP